MTSNEAKAWAASKHPVLMAPTDEAFMMDSVELSIMEQIFLLLSDVVPQGIVMASLEQDLPLSGLVLFQFQHMLHGALYKEYLSFQMPPCSLLPRSK